MNTPQSSVKSSGRKGSKKSRDGVSNKGSVKRTSIKSQNGGKIREEEEHDDPNGAVNEEGIKVKVYARVMRERRVLLGCTVAVGLATIVWIIAIATPYWFTLSGGQGIYVQKSLRYFTYSHSGIFYSCRYAFANRTQHQISMTELFDVLDRSPSTRNNTYNATHMTILASSPDEPDKFYTYNETHTTKIGGNRSVSKQEIIDKFNADIQAEVTRTTSTSVTNAITKVTTTLYKSCSTPHFSKPKKKQISYDEQIVDYNRAEATFAVITILLMVMAFFFSIYTFRNPRYMFKRTAGGLHFLSTGSCLTVIEVVAHSLHYEKQHLPFVFPPGARDSFGVSYYLAWGVFCVNLLTGFFFMLYSRKRKGKKAPTEEMGMADEAIAIGR